MHHFIASIVLSAAAAAASAHPATNVLPDPDKVLLFYAFDDPANGTNAQDISYSGIVIGSYFSESQEPRGFIRKPDGQYINLDVTVGDSVTGLTLPVAISEVGTIVGRDAGTGGSGPVRSWIYDIASGVASEISYPGAFSTVVEDMNESGVVVGYAQFEKDIGLNRRTVGFIWESGTFRTYALENAYLTSFNALNKAGQIVGRYTFLNEDGSPRSTSQFIMQPNGDYRTFELVIPRGRTWTANTLGNDGDVAGGCYIDETFLEICYREKGKATRTITLIDCDGVYTYITSIKRGLTTGSCREFSSYVLKGFIATKQTLLNQLGRSEGRQTKRREVLDAPRLQRQLSSSARE